MKELGRSWVRVVLKAGDGSAGRGSCTPPHSLLPSAVAYPECSPGPTRLLGRDRTGHPPSPRT